MSLSTSDKLKVEIDGHVALITIDNPAANTWDTESLPALQNLIEKLNADKTIFALVLTGEGEKFFSAGADLKLFADGEPDTARKMSEYFGSGFECLADFRGVSSSRISSSSESAACALIGVHRTRPATTTALALFLKLQRFIDLVSKIELYRAEIVAFGGHP